MTSANLLRRWPERTLLERLLEKSQVRPDGCVVFTGFRDRNGYGRIGVDAGVTRFAHRVAYSLLVGPIPDGLTIDHLCRNRACINVLHLEAVTAAENTLRGDSIPAHNARKTHCPSGHEYTPENTRIILRANGSTCRACRTCDVQRRDERRAA